MKAILARLGTFERSHFVADVLKKRLADEELAAWRAHLEQVAAVAERLEKNVTRARYIIEEESGEDLWNPADHYSETDSVEAQAQANTALSLASEFVDWWFGPHASALA